MNRHLARHTRVPADWRETLAAEVPALRAQRGKLPDVLFAAVLMGDGHIEVFVPDAANDCSHAFEFDHVPTLCEIATCERVVSAPHN